MEKGKCVGVVACHLDDSVVTGVSLVVAWEASGVVANVVVVDQLDVGKGTHRLQVGLDGLSVS